MAAIAWRKRLQSLSLPQKEKGPIVHRLFAAKWGEEGIQTFFDTCVECGGEEALILALQDMLRGEDVTQEKRVQIFIPRAQGEELVPVGSWFDLTVSSFNSIVPESGYLVPFKGGHWVKDGKTVLHFRDLVQGESYLLHDFGGFSSRLKASENFNLQEMHSSEQELAASMVEELKVYGIAENPITRDDLRVHCQGTAEEQEFDAVLLDGELRAFIGSAKHVVHGASEVEDMLNKVRILANRARDIERYPSYVPFHGRALGYCIKIDTIKEAHEKAVKHLCFRKGVGLFQRSGAALAIQHIPFTGAQSLEPGFINMVVRGIKRLAH